MKSAYRVLEIYIKLASKESLLVSEVIETYDISLRTAQRDIEIINNLIEPKNSIVYDKVGKFWKLNNSNISYLNDSELQTMQILKQLSKSNGNQFMKSTHNLFDKLSTSLESSIYTKVQSETIDNFKDIIPIIDKAVINNQIINFFYETRQREVYPINILNFNGIWYLIAYDPKQKKIRRFYLNSIEKLFVEDQIYDFDITNIKTSYENAINVYFDIEKEPFEVILHATKKISKVLQIRPLSNSQRVIKIFDDGSIDISIYITNIYEIIPTIMKYAPNLLVIDNEEIKQQVISNFNAFINQHQ